jgi:hypothetical protein
MPYKSANKPGRNPNGNKRKPISKKKQIREMRPVGRKNPGGGTSSHKMAWTGDPKKKKGNYGVFPTISPKKGKEKSSDPADWKKQSASEAAKKGEMIKVKRKKKAEKLAAGSWKKGADKREAMKSYRNTKKKKR